MASGSTTYPSTNERTNYACLCRAIVDLCTDVLREVLSTLVVPSQLRNKVQTCADLKTKPLNADERHKINVASNSSSYRHLDITFLYKLINSFSTQELRDDLSSFIHPSQILIEVQRYPSLLSSLNKEQEAKVKYASTTGNYTMCDCWLLSHLLKTLCPGNIPKLLPSTNKWGSNSLPLPTKTNYGDDVERIRFLRNKVYGHVSDTCVADAEFQTQWAQLSGIMSRMDHRLKTGGRYTNDLKDIETDCMDDKVKEEFISEIKKLADADKDVRSEIGKQGEEILYLRTKVETVEKSTEQLHTSVKDLKKMEIEVSQELKDNMSEVKAKLQDDIDKLKQESMQDKINTNEAMAKYKAEVGSRISQVEAGVSTKLDEMSSNIEDVRKEKTSQNTSFIEDIKAPDGVKPPALVSQVSTAITATWQAVGRANSKEAPQCILQFRELSPKAIVQDIFGPTSAFTYTKTGLLPYTEYEFRLVACNSHGDTWSEWVTQVTRQDKPSGFDPPLVVAVGARYLDLTWQPPLVANGVLKEYIIYQNEQKLESVAGNVTSLRGDNLNPFTAYRYSVDACTLGGCTRSANSNVARTLRRCPREDLNATSCFSDPCICSDYLVTATKTKWFNQRISF